MPVMLDGLKLSGGGTATADTKAGTIASSRSVRWSMGRVQIRRARFSWKRNAPLAFAATGGVRGLTFGGNGVLRFTGANGGTATFRAKVAFRALADTKVSGDAVLTVGRRRAFDVRKVHVRVTELALERLAFKKLDFRYANSAWSADASVRLPAFTITQATVDGHIGIVSGRVHDIRIEGSGLRVPLGAGLVLIKAGLSLNFRPVVVKGTAAATYGPAVAGVAPLRIDGLLQYRSEPQHWDANGAVTLPWGLPGVKPKVTVALGLDPGRSMTFKGHLDLTVHGFGITGDLQGFASPSAFNVEGQATLALTPLNLKGEGLISSRGMSACGRVKLKAFGFGVGVGPRLGFGYAWGGGFHFIHSSCDVGPFRVVQSFRAAPFAAATNVVTSSPAQFAVFALQGQGDFRVTGPTGTFTSVGDRDTVDSFALHDASDNTVYLAIPVLNTPSVYAVTTLAGGAVTAVNVASGVESLAGDVTGSVSGTGRDLTLTYNIDTAALQPGESISFYEGQSSELPGANPIVENVTANGVAQFTPEATGDTTRTVRAVVFDNGIPREQFFIASFTTVVVPPPTAFVFIRTGANPPGGWGIFLEKPLGVALWEIATSTDDGRHDFVELPAQTASYSVAQGTATHVTARVTPVDQYGREGPTYVCDSPPVTGSATCLPG